MNKELYNEKQNKVMELQKNGGTVFVMTQGIPLFLWVIFILHVKIKKNKCSKQFDTKNIIIKIIYYLLFAIPFLVYINNVYNSYVLPNPLKKVDIDTAISFPPGWKYCVSSNTVKFKKPDILATEDMECFQDNFNRLKDNVNDIITRFYYINNILLLLIIAFRYHTNFNLLKSDHCGILGFSILFGILGTIGVLFTEHEVFGLWMIESLTILLSMNISSFILYLLTSLAQIYK